MDIFESQIEAAIERAEMHSSLLETLPWWAFIRRNEAVVRLKACQDLMFAAIHAKRQFDKSDASQASIQSEEK